MTEKLDFDTMLFSADWIARNEMEVVEIMTAMEHVVAMLKVKTPRQSIRPLPGRYVLECQLV